MKAVAAPLPTADGWAFEIKWDGMRVLTFIDGPEVRLASSTGRDISATFPELADLGHALGAHQVLLDGEMVAFAGERPDFGLLQRRIHVHDAAEAERVGVEVPAQYQIFDLLHLDGIDLTGLPWSDRRTVLEDLVGAGPGWDVPATHRTDGAALLAAARERGLEGLVAKRVDASYESGRRSPAWRKVKVRRRQELVVGGWTAGEGARAGTLGALLVGYHLDGALRFAGSVGTGFDDRELERLRDELTARSSESCPFDPAPPRQHRGAAWCRPELVVEVAFAEWTHEGRLRHPSYLGERVDVDPRTVQREPT